EVAAPAGDARQGVVREGVTADLVTRGELVPDEPRILRDAAADVEERGGHALTPQHVEDRRSPPRVWAVVERQRNRVVRQTTGPHRGRAGGLAPRPFPCPGECVGWAGWVGRAVGCPVDLGVGWVEEEPRAVGVVVGTARCADPTLLGRARGVGWWVEAGLAVV